MAVFDVADCLSRIAIELNRPSTDEALPSSVLYGFLQRGQERAFGDLSVRIPNKQWSDPVLLTTADGGLTYTFGTDAGLPTNYQAIAPEGHIELYPSLAAIPSAPLLESVDFIMEGTLIRSLGHYPRTYPNGPYARFLYAPGVVDGTTGVLTLRPVFARMLIVWDACASACRRLKRDPSVYDSGDLHTGTGWYQRDLRAVLLRMRNQADTEGVGAGQGASGDWTMSQDLGSHR